MIGDILSGLVTAIVIGVVFIVALTRGDDEDDWPKFG